MIREPMRILSDKDYYRLQRLSINHIRVCLQPRVHRRWCHGLLDRVDRLINHVQDQIWQDVSRRTEYPQ